MKGKLYLVATPIGNYDDITLRALKTLKEVDFIICEEFKEARRLLSQYQIQKELMSINEHNEKDFASEIMLKLVEGQNAALISDCGTPLFSDPGHVLVDMCISAGVDIIPVPGANSIIPALTGSGLNIEKFFYFGWLSPKKDVRQQELFRLKKINELIVLLDTPYRLKSVLADIIKMFGRMQYMVIAFDLTMKTEKFYRGTAEKLLNQVEKVNLKGEYVLMIDNTKTKNKY
jgi:probable S-adenosylmethionine-dependent methyltransferase, YraL family